MMYCSVRTLLLLLFLLITETIVFGKNASEYKRFKVENNGIVCLRGIPSGKQLSKKIGPQGGSLISADGRVQVIFPAGSIERDIEVEIIPISNTNLAGNGLAYRINPHGIKFQKLVTVQFSYADKEGSKRDPQLQGIAYQDEQGIWQSIGKGTIDTVKKTIAVQTNHFSDWSEFESMQLVPSETMIVPGEALLLKAIQYFKEDEELIPLSGSAGKETPIGKPFYIYSFQLKNWRLSGVGTLSQKGNEAVYKAPAMIKTNKELAAVSVELNTKKGKVFLVSNIAIVREGISFRIDKQEWKHFEPRVSHYNDIPEYVYGEDFELGNLSVSWEKKSNEQQAWNTTMDGLTISFAYHSKGSFLNYYSTYTVGEAETEMPSPGYVQIFYNPDTENRFISGEFKVERGAMFDALGEKISEHTIEGYFYIRKTVR